MKQLTIILRPDGSIEAEVGGDPGPNCLDGIDDLRRMTGGQVVASQTTDRFFQTVNGAVTDDHDFAIREDLA